MDVFLINLDRRPDRLTHMRDQLDKSGVSFTRINAIDAGADPDLVAECPSLLTPPEYGCYLSHREAWARLAESGEPFAVVLEDDLLITPAFGQILETQEFFPADADLIRLESSLFNSVLDRRVSFQSAGFDLRRKYNFVGGAGAYAISSDFAHRLLALNAPPPIPIDDLLYDGTDYVAPGPRVYCIDPAPTIQIWHLPEAWDRLDSISDLATTREDRWEKGKKAPHHPLKKLWRELSRPWTKFRNTVIHETKPVPFAGED